MASAAEFEPHTRQNIFFAHFSISFSPADRAHPEKCATAANPVWTSCCRSDAGVTPYIVYHLLILKRVASYLSSIATAHGVHALGHRSSDIPSVRRPPLPQRRNTRDRKANPRRLRPRPKVSMLGLDFLCTTHDALVISSQRVHSFLERDVEQQMSLFHRVQLP